MGHDIFWCSHVCTWEHTPSHARTHTHTFTITNSAEPGMVVNSCNHNSQERGAAGSRGQGQPGLCDKIVLRVNLQLPSLWAAGMPPSNDVIFQDLLTAVVMWPRPTLPPLADGPQDLSQLLIDCPTLNVINCYKCPDSGLKLPSCSWLIQLLLFR